MIDWPGSIDTSRRLLAGVLLAVAPAVAGSLVWAASPPPMVTLWSADGEAVSRPQAAVEEGSDPARPPIYRLPHPTAAAHPSWFPPLPSVQSADQGPAVTSTGSSVLGDPKVDGELAPAAPPAPPALAAGQQWQFQSPAPPKAVEVVDERTIEPGATAAHAPWHLDEQPAPRVQNDTPAPRDEISPIAENQHDRETPPAAVTVHPAFPNTPTVSQVSDQVVPACRRAYSLAQRGAMYAASDEFIEVLRRIAHAKDAQHHTAQHARSLAEGLRALDEADDFIPAGVELEADLDVAVVARSHRTTVLRDAGSGVLPHDAVARYHAYAQQQIATAVAGDQAGSMALYGLGKIHSRFANDDDADLQSVRKSMTMYHAALTARPDNHLAANELGVLLAQCGHHGDALAMFQRAVRISPDSTAMGNLASVQRKLGDERQADATLQESHRLAQWEHSVGAVSRQLGVNLVSPDEMSRQSPPPPRPADAMVTAEPIRPPPASRRPPRERTAARPRWPWQRETRATSTDRAGGPQANQRMEPAPSNTLWR